MRRRDWPTTQMGNKTQREGGTSRRSDWVGWGMEPVLYVDADPLSYVDPNGLVRRIRDPLDLMPLKGNGGAGLGSGGSGGARPANFSSPGSGRSGAFNEAKRLNGVPTSQQPTSVSPNRDRKERIQPGRQYEFEIPNGISAPRKVIIRDDAGGHNFGPTNIKKRFSFQRLLWPSF